MTKRTTIPRGPKTPKWVSKMEQMKVGDSFFVTCPTGVTLARHASRVSGNIHNSAARLGIRVSYRRTVKGERPIGVRIWRVE